MPSEKFYPSDSVEDELTQILEIAWANPGEYKEGHYENVFVMTYVKKSGSSGDVYDLMSFDLDRSGLNRLIRSLRRARNAVYGVDE